MAELIRIREGIFQKLGDRHYAARAVENALDRIAERPQVGYVNPDAASQAGQLQTVADVLRDAVHRIVHRQFEAADELSARHLAAVQGGRRRRLISRHHRFDRSLRQMLVPLRQVQSDNDDAILVFLENFFAVPALHRITLVKFAGAHERRETELVCVRFLVELLDKLRTVLLKKLFFIVAFVHEIPDFFFRIDKVAQFCVDVFQEVPARRLFILRKIELARPAVLIKHFII